MNCRLKGFTLMELVIVVLVVILLFSLLMPLYADYQSRTAVENGAQLFAQDLKLMRQKTVSFESYAGICITSISAPDGAQYIVFWNHSVSDTDFSASHLTAAAGTYKMVNLKELFQTMVEFTGRSAGDVIYFDPKTQTNSGTEWYYSYATPVIRSGTASYFRPAQGVFETLLTIKSGNHTSQVKMNREGDTSVSIP